MCSSRWDLYLFRINQMNRKLINRVNQEFSERFNANSLVIASPGRINLIGEHTDYNDGFVFPAAINKGIVLAINKSETLTSIVYAIDMDETYKFKHQNLEPLVNGGWRNYVIGVVAEIEKLGLKIGNFNSVFGGNIPAGAGMSSSAALENSFVFALNELFDLGLSKTEMILISQKAEHDFAGVKCGIMDQFASMFGVTKSALLLDCRTLKAKPYKIDFKDYKLILINTNIKHDLSESAYNERRAVCEKVAHLLKIKALRDASESVLNTIRESLTIEEYQKALYVIQENERVQKFAEAINENDIKSLGNLLYQSHDGLSKKYKVSCKELDFLIDCTKSNKHVLGARMMGGGFGGCTINMVLKSAYKKFKKEIYKKYLAKFGRECSVYNVKLSQGTHVLKK